MTETIQVDEDLTAKRSALEDKISDLRLAPEASELIRQASDAVAKHKAETALLEKQLAEINATVGAREQGRRDDAERLRLERLAEARNQLVKLENERLRLMDECPPSGGMSSAGRFEGSKGGSQRPSIKILQARMLIRIFRFLRRGNEPSIKRTHWVSILPR